MSIFTNPQAITIRYKGIANVISTPVEVFIPDTKNNMQVSAIWDTGATGTAITSHLVQQLGLVPTGKKTVNTAGGSFVQNTYTVDVGLPNSVLVQSVIATEVPGLSSNNEVLIGMDIISLGDFSITQYNRKTCMSFRIPSLHEIDYAGSPKLKINTDQPKTRKVRLGRNDPCHCGSGKKFKHCHGRKQ